MGEQKDGEQDSEWEDEDEGEDEESKQPLIVCLRSMRRRLLRMLMLMGPPMSGL